MSETTRLANQLRRAFKGEAWHGPSVLEILDGIDAKKAATHPIDGVHSIWEIVVHMAVWDNAARRRMAGEVVQPTPEQDWPHIAEFSERGWRRTLQELEQTHENLVKAVTSFSDSRLDDRVPGKQQKFYNFYYMLYGIAQHQLYHAGQIAILKKA